MDELKDHGGDIPRIEQLTKILTHLSYEKDRNLKALEASDHENRAFELWNSWIDCYEAACENAAGIYYPVYVEYSLDFMNHEIMNKYNEVKRVYDKIKNVPMWLDCYTVEGVCHHFNLEAYVSKFNNHSRLMDRTYKKGLNNESRSQGLDEYKTLIHENISSLYSKVTQQYSFTVKMDNQERKIGFSQLIPLLYSKNEIERKKARVEFLNRYKDDVLVFESILNCTVKSQLIEDELLQSGNTFRTWCNEYDLDYALAQSLQAQLVKHSGVVKGYYKWKFKRYDCGNYVWNMSAPLPELKTKISLDKIEAFVEDVIGGFDSEILETVKSVFKSGIVDLTPKKQKKPGALCFSPSIQNKPFISMHFGGSVNDLMTLAHELGHAVHKQYSIKHQSHLNFAPSIILSESIARFFELVFLDFILDRDFEKGSDTRKEIINEKVIAPVFSMNMLSIFERGVYDSIETDGRLNYENISKTFISSWKKIYGEVVQITDEVKYTWLLYPHFFDKPLYINAYCYANLFGFIFFLKYMENKDIFSKDLKTIMMQGRSKSITQIFMSIGLDIGSDKQMNDVFEKNGDVFK